MEYAFLDPGPVILPARQAGQRPAALRPPPAAGSAAASAPKAWTPSELGPDRVPFELDIGHGTVWLPRSGITRIKRSGSPGAAEAAEWRRRSFESGRNLPAGSERLYELYREMRSSRERAIEARTEERQHIAEIERTELQMPSFARRNAASGKAEAEMARINRPGMEYNPTFDRIRGENIRIGQELVNRRDRLVRLADKIQRAQVAIVGHIETHRRVPEFLNGEGVLLLSAAKKANPAFYAWFDGEMIKFGGEIETAVVPAQRHTHHLVVEAVLNSTLTVRLAVDPYRTKTVLYREAAVELWRRGQLPFAGLEEAMAHQSSYDTAMVDISAEGRVQARASVLDSISIGGFRVDKSDVGLLGTPGRGLDGVLGKPFLAHFLFEVDSERLRLVLKRFR